MNFKAKNAHGVPNSVINTGLLFNTHRKIKCNMENLLNQTKLQLPPGFSYVGNFTANRDNRRQNKCVKDSEIVPYQ